MDKAQVGLMDEVENLRNRVAELEKAVDRCDALSEGIADGIIIHDEEGGILDANKVTCERLGYGAEELRTMHLRDVVVPERVDEIGGHVGEVRLNQTARFETEYLTRDGRRIPCEVLERLVRLDGRNAIQSVARDITERKRGEQLLRALNHAALAMERASAPKDIFVIVDAELKALGFSCAVFLADESQSRLFLTYLGYAKSALRAAERLGGVKVEDFSIPIDGSEICRCVIRERETLLVENAVDFARQVMPSFVKPFAEQIIGLLGVPRSIVSPLIVEDRVVGMLSVQSNDLTERDVPAITAFAHQMAAAWRKANLMQDLSRSLAELKQAQAQLLRAQKMESIGTLAGGVAHNFNNILGIILGNAELAKMGIGESHEAAEFLNKIISATERAAGLAQQLLSVAQRGAAERAHVGVSALVGGVARAMRDMLDSHIEVNWRVADDLPPIMANQAEIEQVLMNICLNARDAMPKGGTLTISADVADVPAQFRSVHENIEPGQHVFISIADTGTGMGSDTLSRIFEPFFTTKGPHKGIGLGLFAAYGIVANHDGCIDVESELGKGSLFRVYLPAAPVGEAADLRQSAAEPMGGSETILVVDDEEDIVQITSRNLKSLGYTVLAARNGKEAVDVYAREGERIDLVLLDYMMPHMDGEDAYLAVKKINPHVKVIIASGYNEENKIKPLLDLGVNGFLHKPFHHAALSRLLRDVLDRKSG